MYEKYEEKFNVIYPESENATYITLMNYSDDLQKPLQRWYRYKEGYSVDLVKQLISEYSKNPNGVILDPFTGSGSTLLGAAELGYETKGFEVNPFSYFLASTKLKNYSNEIIDEFKSAYSKIVFYEETLKEEYTLPELSISNKVFEPHIEKVYMSIKKRIEKYDTQNIEVKALLTLGWLACLENLSTYRKAGNGLKKRKYVKPRIITERDVIETLLTQYENMYQDCINNNISFNNTIYNESCLNMLDKIEEASISGIIFSPPYANCFDYTEIYKLELWFGEFVNQYSDLKKLRLKSLRSHLNGDLNIEGVEFIRNDFLEQLILQVEQKQLWDKKIPRMLRLYFEDMFTVLTNCYKVLEEDGFCVIVVGNSSYGGIIIPTDLILAAYAEELGFEVDKIEVDRYIITSSQQYEITKENKKYLRESLICLKKKKK